MSTLALRRLRLWAPVVEVALVSLFLFPAIGATASDGPADGASWAWNVLGWPVAAGEAGFAIWLGAALIAAVPTLLLTSLRLLNRIDGSDLSGSAKDAH